jgi:hypothetical protein
MLRILGTATLLLSLYGVGGCDTIWQANNASQGVEFNSSKVGTGEPAFTPADTYGFINGEPQDMRSKR